MSSVEHEYELKQVIVSTLQLKDATADTIDSEEPLFETGLGLDSVDGLELALGIERHFGIKIEPSEETAAQIFASVRVLAEHLESKGAWARADRS